MVRRRDKHKGSSGHQNVVGVSNGVQAVGDRQDGAVAEHLAGNARERAMRADKRKENSAAPCARVSG